MLTIAIGSDHAGFEYKERIREFLADKGYQVKDFGTFSNERCDYPDFIFPVAKAVAAGEYDRGIVLGGSGNGEAIAANRVKGVRCSLAWDIRSARLGREHNDANVLSMGQRMLAIEEAFEIVELWLTTDFEGGRHEGRLAKCDQDI